MMDTERTIVISSEARNLLFCKDGLGAKVTTGLKKKSRVLSGMRPTGRLHIGHYFGALQNWVRLQNDPCYDCFYFIADWHALTSDYADTSAVAHNTLEIMTDYLAAGLDPQKSVLFQQSQVPEHAELHLLLSMVTPLGWLERVPTYKEALENVKDRDLHTYGFLGYPCLQAADIVRSFNSYFGLRIDERLLHNPKLLKRVREVSAEIHSIELPDPTTISELQEAWKRVVRRGIAEFGFQNFLDKVGDDGKFFKSIHVLQEPEAMLTQTPRIPGLDGRKMSKSYSNAIMLTESDADIRAKTKVMVTDPARKRRSDPGNPDVCPVYDWHKLFSPAETLKWSAEGCRTAGIGCIECKAAMA